ncbi:hypothetical protein EYF80_046398 [Liparis tanakae]|uniref:Uncharacterized protein n=1 Tax=Liparis tanakae TaxID=230148 RepID=A0A4Z2FQH6_9TELE|nr:hypothetical protein EYF80_046398 [Liparis tanakae]
MGLGRFHSIHQLLGEEGSVLMLPACATARCTTKPLRKFRKRHSSTLKRITTVSVNNSKYSTVPTESNKEKLAAAVRALRAPVSTSGGSPLVLLMMMMAEMEEQR